MSAPRQGVGGAVVVGAVVALSMIRRETAGRAAARAARGFG
ncbi:hypothetical protein ACFXDH_35655 [Streptomyces sp. NPDC059467]